jgi:hypothetical protein
VIPYTIGGMLAGKTGMIEEPLGDSEAKFA